MLLLRRGVAAGLLGSAEHVATLNKLRVQYSKEIVNQACLKMGWQKVVKSENKLLLRKGV